MERSYLSLPEIFKQRKKDVLFSDYVKNLIQKKHNSARAIYANEKEISVYTSRFEYIYTMLSENFIVCQQTPADRMGTHGKTETKYFKI